MSNSKGRRRVDSLELIVCGLLAALVVALAFPIFEKILTADTIPPNSAPLATWETD